MASDNHTLLETSLIALKNISSDIIETKKDQGDESVIHLENGKKEDVIIRYASLAYLID